MSDFKREERYIVFKLKELTLDQTCDLRDYITEQGINTPECVVVESDWPNYKHVWQTIEQVANGTFDPDEITRLQAENEALRARVIETDRDIRAACAEIIEVEAEKVGAKQGLARKMCKIRLMTIAERLRGIDSDDALERQSVEGGSES